ncbi:MAG: 2-hydroxyacid dehydrogenase [Verrucomicrobia bacterium]|nr:2-hydroxyacid dehydrogenase [Verrucomicrobiota bacterium]
METRKPIVGVFDTKPYDRDYLTRAVGSGEVAWHFHDFRLEPETALAAKGAQAVCVFVNDVVNREVVEGLAASGVGLVALRCAGFNNVDLTAVKELGLVVTRVPSYSPHAVAEHAIALILALNRKIYRAFNRVRELNFSLNGLVGFDLYGKTAGIVGTGKTGRIVGEILRGFQMRVLASDPYPNQEWAAKNGITYVEMSTLVKESDLISLHAPLTPQTDRIINAETLAQMKPGVILVNVSRGRLVHTKALIKALKSGHVGGVALDVYEEEEGVFFEDLSLEILHDDELARLLTFPNVLVTAHQAFFTREALSEIARVTVENVRRFAGKEALLEGTVL